MLKVGLHIDRDNIDVIKQKLNDLACQITHIGYYKNVTVIYILSDSEIITLLKKDPLVNTIEYEEKIEIMF